MTKLIFRRFEQMTALSPLGKELEEMLIKSFIKNIGGEPPKKLLKNIPKKTRI